MLKTLQPHSDGGEARRTEGIVQSGTGVNQNVNQEPQIEIAQQLSDSKRMVDPG
jgi:hypothetical protein